MSQEKDTKVHARQMLLIDRESNMSILGALFTALFCTYVLYGDVSSVVLLGWFIAIAVVYLVRLLWLRFVYQLDSFNSYQWEKFYIAGTVLGGLVWGIGSYFILPADNPLLQAVITLTVGGLVAAASVTYSPSRFLGSAFSVPALLPLSIFFFQQHGSEYVYMGILVLVYIVVMFVSNHLMHQVTLKSLMLSMKNEVLVDDLKNKIVEINDMANEMSYQASHDILTGLINRREFETRLANAIQQVKHNDRHHALCYMDLDEFKVI
ncbi:MAG: diguanylate cyclase, partial [Thioalkalispiraceae bacterium]